MLDHTRKIRSFALRGQAERLEPVILRLWRMDACPTRAPRWGPSLAEKFKRPSRFRQRFDAISASFVRFDDWLHRIAVTEAAEYPHFFRRIIRHYLAITFLRPFTRRSARVKHDQWRRSRLCQ